MVAFGDFAYYNIGWTSAKENCKETSWNFYRRSLQRQPGPGGWGAILRYNEHEKEISGGEAVTTNNRMEISAVIGALSLLKEPCNVTLYSDSQYVCNALKLGWLKNGKQTVGCATKKKKA